MTLAAPSNVNFGTVKGRFVVAIEDGPDSGTDPDFIAAAGRVTFTASVTRLQDINAVPDPVMILPAPIKAVLDPDGYLCSADAPSNPNVPRAKNVRLIATDDVDLNPAQWLWNVTFDLRRGDTRLEVPSVRIAVPVGSVIDLTTVIPASDADEVSLAVAEAAAAAAATSAQQAQAAAQSAADLVAGHAEEIAEAAISDAIGDLNLVESDDIRLPQTVTEALTYNDRYQSIVRSSVATDERDMFGQETGTVAGDIAGRYFIWAARVGLLKVESGIDIVGELAASGSRWQVQADRGPGVIQVDGRGQDRLTEADYDTDGRVNQWVLRQQMRRAGVQHGAIPQRVASIGNSMLDNVIAAIPQLSTYLAPLLGMAVVPGGAYSAHTSDEICVRDRVIETRWEVGAPADTVTAHGTLAAGSAVPVQIRLVSPATLQHNPSNNFTWAGSVTAWTAAGVATTVPGSITYVGSSLSSLAFYFTPTAAPSETLTLRRGFVFTPSTGAPWAGQVVLIDVGRNDLQAVFRTIDSTLSQQVAHCLARTRSIVNMVLRQGGIPVVLSSFPRRGDTTEAADNVDTSSDGYACRQAILTLNAAYAEHLGEFYVDTFNALRLHGLEEVADLGIAPDATNISDRDVKKCIPRALMVDTLHLNVAGKTALARILARAITARTMTTLAA